MDGCGRRLSTTRLFAAVAGGGRSWARADVSRAAGVCDLRRGPAALSWFRGLAWVGSLFLAPAALLPAVAAVEHRPAITAALYLYYTLASAYAHMRRRGGE